MMDGGWSNVTTYLVVEEMGEGSRLDPLEAKNSASTLVLSLVITRQLERPVVVGGHELLDLGEGNLYKSPLQNNSIVGRHRFVLHPDVLPIGRRRCHVVRRTACASGHVAL